MTAKLHINISQGIIDVEGDVALVREIYTDFKDQLLNGVKVAREPPKTPGTNDISVDEPEGKQKSKRRAPIKKKAVSEDSGSGISADQPKLDKNLDTAALPRFFSDFAPKNHSDKILIFLKFLIDELVIAEPNTDQVYTCYKAVGEKFPQAFKQAFHTANTQHGYIDFKSATEMSIPIAGENRFAHGLKKKSVE